MMIEFDHVIKKYNDFTLDLNHDLLIDRFHGSMINNKIQLHPSLYKQYITVLYCCQLLYTVYPFFYPNSQHITE